MFIIKKRFGQNFLIDNDIINKIISKISPLETDIFLEIGPGHGAITKKIAKKCKKLYCVEIDQELSAKLKNNPDLNNCSIINFDILKFDINNFIKEEGLYEKKIRVIGNLPYNISTQIIFHLDKSIKYIDDIHFTVQKEVADRLTSKQSRKSYGRLSINSQIRYEIEQLLKINSSSFYPIPKVLSSFIKMKPKVESIKKINNYLLFDNIIKSAFSQKRKMVRNSLSNYIATKDFKKIGIGETCRPQDISIETFIMLSNYIGENK